MANVGKFILKKANRWRKGGKLGAVPPTDPPLEGTFIVDMVDAKGDRSRVVLEAIAEDKFLDGMTEIPWSDVVKYLAVGDVES